MAYNKYNKYFGLGLVTSATTQLNLVLIQSAKIKE